MKYSLTLLGILFASVGALAQPSAQQRIHYDETKRQFSLENSLVKRVLQLTPSGLQTVAYTDLRTKTNVIRDPNRVREIAFQVNGIPFTGRGAAGFAVTYKTHTISEKVGQGSVLRVDLQVQHPNRFIVFDLSLYYQIYADLPLTRKWLTIRNTGGDPLRISELDWENLNLDLTAGGVGLTTAVDVYAAYGRLPTRPPYIGRTDDAALLIHNPEQNTGILLGNEAPAVMKRTHVYRDSTEVGIGMGFEADDFPFQKTLLTDETFTSPKAFVSLFKGAVWQDAFAQDLATYVRTQLGTRLFAHKKTPTAFYNTRLPFGRNLNGPQLKKLVDELAPTGIDYLILDDGWQDNYGDWNVDTRKFPNGLRPLTDYIRAKGMTPGLWLALATAADTSAVGQEHADWFMNNRDGQRHSLQGSGAKNLYTMSLDTPWFDYILQKIRTLVDEHGLGYIKLDLAAACSAYRLNSSDAGDWATGAGRTYANQRESLWRLYERTGQLMDSLKASHPNLLIDCTHELYGKANGVDLWLLQHADYAGLASNRIGASAGSRALRQLTYDRGQVVPSGTLLTGNLRLDEPLAKQQYLSMASSTIVFTGDVAKLLPTDKAWLKAWNGWLAALNERTQYTRFYQTGDVLPRPDTHNWDGAIRFNPERNGGLLCFYRNDSPEATRIFPIRGVKPAGTYLIRQGGTNAVVGTFTGQQLLTTGLPVTIPNRNEASLLSIEPFVKPEAAKVEPIAAKEPAKMPVK
ncbi:alpha-galactosidase [Fibrella aestuarina BUZ 2]|uniref:Alpha-galactosidase n=1 Tax=Fibrella aestuarina BUZ 2 TaxID=1166018 RepID=I0K445_9BACT|nr:glycoside hydrolase family 36 protein [Fibrella aestuarina]CCG98898.1 alpha-galactosidase [Fibrella aestuarina BUZ 2]